MVATSRSSGDADGCPSPSMMATGAGPSPGDQSSPRDRIVSGLAMAVERADQIAARRVFSLSSLPEPLAHELQYFDEDGDGNICLTELAAMIQRFRAQDEANEALSSKDGGTVDLSAFPEEIGKAMSTVFPHDAASNTIRVGGRAEGGGGFFKEKRNEIEARLHDMQIRMKHMMRIMVVGFSIFFVLTLGTLFGLMVGADELIYTKEIKTSPDGTMYTASKPYMPVKVLCYP